MFKYLTLIFVTMIALISLPVLADETATTTTNESFFTLEKQGVKVAPRDPHDRCKTNPESQPYCPKKKKKTDNGTYAKLKCKKAKTCDEETLLSKLRKLLV